MVHFKTNSHRWIATRKCIIIDVPTEFRSIGCRAVKPHIRLSLVGNVVQGGEDCKGGEADDERMCFSKNTQLVYTHVGTILNNEN